MTDDNKKIKRTEIEKGDNKKRVERGMVDCPLPARSLRSRCWARSLRPVVSELRVMNISPIAIPVKKILDRVVC